MHYQGGKGMLWRYIVPELHRYIGNRTYLEPFCGMCNIVKNVKAKERIASDLCEDLILMWKEGQAGNFVPPYLINKELFDKLRKSPPSALRGFAGTNYAFNGIWYHKYKNLQLNRTTNLCNQFKDACRKMYNVTFHHCNYKQWENFHDAFIYCDPPYLGSFKYETVSEKFSHPEFWEQCRRWVNQNNIVFVSEYTAPADFVSVWQMPYSLSKEGVNEHLFVLKGSLA